MKVYVLTTGSYSDYGIEKIFLDKDKAEEFRKWYNDANPIEEYEIEDGTITNKCYRILLKYEFNYYEESKPEITIEKVCYESIPRGGN